MLAGSATTTSTTTPITCLRHVCVRARPSSACPPSLARRYSAPNRPSPAHAQASREGRVHDGDEAASGPAEPRGRGAMSRRLSEMTEQSIGPGGRDAQRTVAEAGFSEVLRKSLEQRIENARFKSDSAAAVSLVDLPEGAGRGTRDLAAAQPWTGAEQTEDAVLRMLSDAHPPLKGSRSPQLPVIRPPSAVKPRKRSSGHRLVNARDRSSVYAIAKGASLSEKEKDQMRRELKERFSPGARPMPTSVQGLASLANERIEDAIARGQFKNLPRGDIIQRDYNASSPFLDTTEYFMNKIIQKQEIVPPWIEKQQELVKAAAVFRGRLRADWKRHAARTIASKGGSLREQVKRAEAYAVAEASVAPRPPAERLKKGSIEALATMDDDEPALAAATAMDALAAVENDTLPVFDSSPPSQEPFTSDDASDVRAAQETRQPQPHPPPPTAILQPFRDPAWLAAEHSYLTLAVTTLNNQTRSYNLMAPDLAKKPYFSLDRELRACYADVAPLLPGEIHERARAPARREEAIGHRPGGVLERLGGDTARVWDDRRKPYGFREFWRDLWARG